MQSPARARYELTGSSARERGWRPSALRTARLASALVPLVFAMGCVDESPEPPKPRDCAAPTVDCGLACTDPASDPDNCGACGHACGASEFCSAGACVASCGSGLTACDRSCLDLVGDARHCGGCDRPCAGGFACNVGACVPADGSAPPSDLRIRVSGAELTLCGRPIYMNGANTPWHVWNDFGGGAYDASWWSGHYADIHGAGVNSSRVWITCSGEVGIQIGPDGAVLGATSAHWDDLTSFFGIAQQQQVYVMASLMSFDHFKDGAESSWRAWIASDANIDSYVQNYLIPFLQRFADNPYLWSIDLMNEPDWAYENSGISFDRLRAYFARAARAIHENSNVLVTVGMASPKYSAACGGCEPSISDEQLRAALDAPGAQLDFYSPHYYDWVGRQWGNTIYESPLSAGFPSSKPLLIGEHPAHGTSGHTLSEDISAAFDRGWQGTLPWTSNGVDGNGGFPLVSVAATAFRDAHPELVFPTCP